MLHCPYENNRQVADGSDKAQCLVLSVACGFVVTLDGCDVCIDGERWNNADVPQLKPEDAARTPLEKDATALVKEDPFFESLYKQALKGRLIGGDCPRYQIPNPVDVDAAFTKYRTAAGDQAARYTLTEMYEYQSKIQESDGGDSAEVLADKMATLAEKNGMEDVLLEAVVAHERAALTTE